MEADFFGFSRQKQRLPVALPVDVCSPMGRRKGSGISAAIIAHRIVIVRGQRVMLDNDLAALYEVATKSLNLAVRRNMERFPADFMFQLTAAEFGHLRLQTETSSWGGRRTRPYAFTEQGVAMLSAVLGSARAIVVSVEIMRTFVRLREVLAGHADLARQLAALENKYDRQFKIVFDAIRQLMAEPPPARRRIGFTPT
jgi:hypothetical protein